MDRPDDLPTVESVPWRRSRPSRCLAAGSRSPDGVGRRSSSSEGSPGSALALSRPAGSSVLVLVARSWVDSSASSPTAWSGISFCYHSTSSGATWEDVVAGRTSGAVELVAAAILYLLYGLVSAIYVSVFLLPFGAGWMVTYPHPASGVRPMTGGDRRAVPAGAARRRAARVSVARDGCAGIAAACGRPAADAGRRGSARGQLLAAGGARRRGPGGAVAGDHRVDRPAGRGAFRPRSGSLPAGRPARHRRGRRLPGGRGDVRGHRPARRPAVRLLGDGHPADRRPLPLRRVRPAAGRGAGLRTDDRAAGLRSPSVRSWSGSRSRLSGSSGSRSRTGSGPC